jgi:hypothetical protein
MDATGRGGKIKKACQALLALSCVTTLAFALPIATYTKSKSSIMTECCLLHPEWLDLEVIQGSKL